MEMGFYDRCIARLTDNDTTVLQYFVCEKPRVFASSRYFAILPLWFLARFMILTPASVIIVKNNANCANYATFQQEGHCKLKKYWPLSLS